MARKVYFFTINLKYENKELDYRKLGQILHPIIENNAVDINGTKVFNLTFESDDMHTYLDIFSYRKDVSLFARATKQKPTGSMISREYDTAHYDGLLNGEPESIRGIETCSYLYCDLKKGILAIATSLGAPGEGCFTRIFSKYSTEYEISLLAVPNPDGISRIYGKSAVEISQISVDVPVPDPVLLESIFGVDGKELYDEISAEKLKAQIRFVSNVKKGKITDNTEDSMKIIDKIMNRLPLLSAAKLRAKTLGEKTRDYNFYEENFYFPIDIKEFRFENGKKVYLSSDELVNAYSISIMGIYNMSKDFVLGVANRKDD